MEKMGRNTTIIFIPFNTYMVKQAYRTRNPTLLFWGALVTCLAMLLPLQTKQHLNAIKIGSTRCMFTALFAVCELDFVC